jgi:hypothetical protein
MTHEVEGSAEGQVGDAHVLGAEGDEVVHRGRVVSFYIGAEELATCVYDR